MMKVKLLFAWIVLVAGSVSAQVTHTVSQNAGDSPDFATVSAAITAAAAGDTIQILDSAVYDEDFPIIDKTLTIEAAAGQTPTLERSAAGNAAQTVRFDAPDGSVLTIQGASESAKLRLLSSADLGAGLVAPVINTGPSVAQTHSVVLENVIVEISNTLGGIMVNLNNSGAHTLTNVDFVGRVPGTTNWIISCQSAGAITLNNCDFSGAALGTRDFGTATEAVGYAVIVAESPAGSSGDFTFNNCNLVANSSTNNPAGIIMTDAAYDGTVTLNDCNFSVGSFQGDGAIIQSTTNGEVVFNVNRPVFVGSGGGVAFNFPIGAGNGPTLNLTGAVDNKVNLDPLIDGGTALYFRAGGGTFNLTDVAATKSGFGDFFDTFETATTDYRFFAPINITLNRCVLTEEAGGFWIWEQGGSPVVFPDPGSAFPVSLTLNNTIYAGGANSGFGGFNFGPFVNNRTVDDTITLNHSTIAGPYATNQYVFSTIATTTIEGNYSIIDFSGSNLGPSAGAPLTGTLNLLNAPNWVGNLFPNDTIIGDPALTADYRLRSSSAALDAAVGSTETEDFEGDPRPTGSAPDIGADELLVVNDALYWNLF